MFNFHQWSSTSCRGCCRAVATQQDRVIRAHSPCRYDLGQSCIQILLIAKFIRRWKHENCFVIIWNEISLKKWVCYIQNTSKRLDTTLIYIFITADDVIILCNYLNYPMYFWIIYNLWEKLKLSGASSSAVTTKTAGSSEQRQFSWTKFGAEIITTT